MDWPADRVERWPIAKLVPYARNARTHSDAQIAQIAASIKEWGWTIPVLVDESGGLIAGHGRVLAARQLGIADVPVMTARGWSESKKRAYALADNKLTINSDWDPAILALEIAELRDDGFDLSLTGFGDDEIAALMMPAGEGAGRRGSLADRFMVPPFSVLNAREGWWQARKAAWLALGIQSELGRGEDISGKANAIPGGAPMPLDRAKDAKLAARATAEPGGSKMPAADYGKTRARRRARTAN